MSKNNSVTVVITTYKRLPYLYRCLHSVLLQESVKEVIIIDDDPLLSARTFVKSMPSSKLIYIPTGGTGNIAFNRNIGIAHSTGDWIAFCDDDDFWQKDKLNIQLKRLKRDRSSFCSTFATLIDPQYSNVTTVSKKIKLFLLSLVQPALIKYSNHIYLSSVLIRKEVFMELGGFNQDPKLVAIEDFELWLRVLKKYRCSVLSSKLICYQLHEKNISSNKIHMFEKLNYLFSKIDTHSRLLQTYYNFRKICHNSLYGKNKLQS